MRKTQLYLDTSIPSFLYADDAPEKRLITIEFWNLLKVGIFDAFISDVVLLEISRCEKELRQKLEVNLTRLNFRILKLMRGFVSLLENMFRKELFLRNILMTLSICLLPPMVVLIRL